MPTHILAFVHIPHRFSAFYSPSKACLSQRPCPGASCLLLEMSEHHPGTDCCSLTLLERRAGAHSAAASSEVTAVVPLQTTQPWRFPSWHRHRSCSCLLPFIRNISVAIRGISLTCHSCRERGNVSNSRNWRHQDSPRYYCSSLSEGAGALCRAGHSHCVCQEPSEVVSALSLLLSLVSVSFPLLSIVVA